MHVTNITARWTRRLPREPYGHAEAELVAQAVLTEGESLEELAGDLLGTLRAGVSAKLGIGIDAASVEVSAAESPPRSPTTAPAEVEVPATDSGSGQDSEASEAEEASDATSDVDSKTHTSAPELVEPAGWTPSELHSWMMGLVKDGVINAPPLMKVLKEAGGVIRTKDLPQDKVAAVQQGIQELLDAAD